MNLFISCKSGGFQVYNMSSVKQPLGQADSTKELAQLFKFLGVTASTEIYCSSSVDDCEEYGFQPGAARQMVERALSIA
jgi:hypothetical protein